MTVPRTRSPNADRAMRTLSAVLIVSGASTAILVALTGGVSLNLGSLHLSARSLMRPIALAAIGAAIRIFEQIRHARVPRRAVALESSREIHDVQQDASHAVDHLQDAARLGFATFLIVLFGLAVSWQVRACGGLDSYGYVSSASLIASGTLRQAAPLASALPFESATRAVAPLGYVVAPDGSIVPRFPLGFPLLMAPFLAIGPNAVFVVPLLAAAVAVWIAYLFARERDSWAAGALAAALVATDPVFFNQAIQPMSDVPATMWLLLSIWLAVRDDPKPVLSGVAAGLAVLTRPVLLIAAAVIGMSTLRHSSSACARWLAGAVPLVAAQAFLQTWLFGSPFATGYGSNEHLFQLSRVPSNTANYAYWMAVVYGPVAVVAVAGAIAHVVLARTPKDLTIATAVAAAVVGPYLLYVRFDDWLITRFLLPGTAAMLVVAAVALVRVIRMLGSDQWAGLAVLGLALCLGVRSYAFLRREGVHNLARVEAKYPLVGLWIAEHTPADAVVVSSLFSGSIRYYAGRTTIRWDEIPPGLLRDTVIAITRLGRPCYLSLDGPEEEDLFRARFGRDLSRITFVPAGRVHGRNIEMMEVR